MTGVLPAPRTLTAAAVAGVAGGLTILACYGLFDGLLGLAPGFTLGGLFAFDASALVGKAAYTGAGYVALGAVLHFLVAIGWAAGYAIVAERQAQLVRRPLISGAAFGAIVYFAMQLVLVAANLYELPTPSGLGVALLAHLAFYGLPVALIIARAQLPK